MIDKFDLSLIDLFSINFKINNFEKNYLFRFR